MNSINKGTLLGLLLFAAAGVWLVYRTLTTYQDIQATYNWTSTEAAVNFVDWNVHKDNDGGETYRTTLTYTYKIGEESFRGHQIGAGYGRGNTDRHAEVYEKLRYARRIRIFVDPENPANSTVTRGWNETGLFFLLFTLIWCCGIGGMIFWTIGEKNFYGRLMARILAGIAILLFVGNTIRLVAAKDSDRFVIKLEEKIGVLERKNDQEISREQLLERARRAAFEQAKTGQDTIRIRLDQDTFHIQ